VGPDGIRRGDWQSPRGPISNRPAGAFCPLLVLSCLMISSFEKGLVRSDGFTSIAAPYSVIGRIRLQR